MELEFELDEYVNEEHREFGATLIVDAHYSTEQVSGAFWGRPFTETQKHLEVEGATLFTYDQDGGNKRELEVDAIDYVSETEIMERLDNE